MQWYRFTSLTSSIYHFTRQCSLIHLPDNYLIWVMWSRLDRIGVVIDSNHTLLNTQEAIQADLKAKLCMHTLYVYIRRSVAADEYWYEALSTDSNEYIVTVYII